MPCSDVTELIRVVVDANDVLKDYRFIKRTCGQGVGVDTLLMDRLAGQKVEDILAIEPQAFLEAYPVEEPIEEFLNLKHLIAVQSALEVLTGRASGGPKDICAAAEISCEGEDTVLEARISVELMTQKIESCGGCKGCGKTRTPKKKRVVFQ
ncbi:MAG: hypothetical protein IT368_15430 [Candidatus Hydrogenedentes bacterium]|nr:hypothetical protein [Candidatus Hydrogenedentota bacterium]